jgi:hypothetical protein
MLASCQAATAPDASKVIGQAARIGRATVTVNAGVGSVVRPSSVCCCRIATHTAAMAAAVTALIAA